MQHLSKGQDRAMIADEVRRAITKGADSHASIRQRTGRSADQIADALAYLLDRNLIRRTRDGNRNVYRTAPPRRTGNHRIPSLSFSTLKGLMPRARSLSTI